MYMRVGFIAIFPESVHKIVKSPKDRCFILKRNYLSTHAGIFNEPSFENIQFKIERSFRYLILLSNGEITVQNCRKGDIKALPNKSW